MDITLLIAAGCAGMLIVVLLGCMTCHHKLSEEEMHEKYFETFRKRHMLTTDRVLTARVDFIRNTLKNEDKTASVVSSDSDHSYQDLLAAGSRPPMFHGDNVRALTEHGIFDNTTSIEASVNVVGLQDNLSGHFPVSSKSLASYVTVHANSNDSLQEIGCTKLSINSASSDSESSMTSSIKASSNSSHLPDKIITNTLQSLNKSYITPVCRWSKNHVKTYNCNKSCDELESLHLDNLCRTKDINLAGSSNECCSTSDENSLESFTGCNSSQIKLLLEGPPYPHEGPPYPHEGPPYPHEGPPCPHEGLPVYEEPSCQYHCGFSAQSSKSTQTEYIHEQHLANFNRRASMDSWHCEMLKNTHITTQHNNARRTSSESCHGNIPTMVWSKRSLHNQKYASLAEYDELRNSKYDNHLYKSLNKTAVPSGQSEITPQSETQRKPVSASSQQFENTYESIMSLLTEEMKQGDLVEVNNKDFNTSANKFNTWIIAQNDLSGHHTYKSINHHKTYESIISPNILNRHTQTYESIISPNILNRQTQTYESIISPNILNRQTQTYESIISPYILNRQTQTCENSSPRRETNPFYLSVCARHPMTMKQFAASKNGNDRYSPFPSSTKRLELTHSSKQVPSPRFSLVKTFLGKANSLAQVRLDNSEDILNIGTPEIKINNIYPNVFDSSFVLRHQGNRNLIPYDRLEPLSSSISPLNTYKTLSSFTYLKCRSINLLTGNKKALHYKKSLPSLPKDLDKDIARHCNLNMYVMSTPCVPDQSIDDYC